MTITRNIESSSVETLDVELRSEADPTGGAVEFSLVARTATDPGTWSAGSWDAGVTWTSASKLAQAITPTIGTAGTLVTTEGATHKLFVRVGGGPVKLAAYIVCT